MTTPIRASAAAAINVACIAAAVSVEELRARVHAWARSASEAWAPHHETIQAWVDGV
jgi:hypothetical protein